MYSILDSNPPQSCLGTNVGETVIKIDRLTWWFCYATTVRLDGDHILNFFSANDTSKEELINYFSVSNLDTFYQTSDLLISSATKWTGQLTHVLGKNYLWTVQLSAWQIELCFKLNVAHKKRSFRNWLVLFGDRLLTNWSSNLAK